VVVTHHLAVAVDLCKRAILLREGRKVEDLPMEELLRNRTLLVQFGFDPDFAQWLSGRSKTSERIGS
jgi:ABC-type multidrug transport system ATPase subunit